MIEVRDINKTFGKNQVLRDVSLDIPDNNILVILGPSGQGKTVLIKTIVRLIEPDSGRILYDGEDILQQSRMKFEAVQKKIAYVFQQNALFDFLDVRDNLNLYLRMHTKLKEEEIERRILNAIRFVQLEPEVLTKYPEELSGGMQKRVAIARAIIKDPCYFFYDEPTVGLDEGNVGKIIDLIQKLQEKVCATAIIVTHDVHLMRAVADRVALLKKGQIIKVGNNNEITEKDLNALYDIGESQ